MARLDLIGRDNGAGLSRDMALLAEALREAGNGVTLSGLPHRGRLAEWATRLRLAWRAPAQDINLMLERIRPEFLRGARRNVVIPNPEYFRPFDRAHLAAMDAVWVKTRHAERLFGALGARTQYIGFTSPDRLDASVPRKHAFFHGPGRSGNKGTEALLRLWAAHPSWPQLTVAWRRKRVDIGALPANVTLLREHLDDAAYRRLQNEHRFHLCPSQTEGYGHYLVEAMSCGAVVITCDAPPMHELVDPSRGLLVRTGAGTPFNLAQRYCFDEAALEAVIAQVLAMPPSQRDALGAQARAWFEDNHRSFATRLEAALREVL